MASDLLFSEEQAEEQQSVPQSKKWKLLIIDDEPDIHQVTELVLAGFNFDKLDLEFLHAYSAKEAIEILEKTDDVAVALVDVVMETNHAGLDLIKYIREEICNQNIRLILRTGQPGEAPEESVIRNFDINDYKNKTELTALKLKTLMFATLRSYRDLMRIEQQKQGLEHIIAATVNFLECDTLTQFASTILTQVANVLGLSERKIYCCAAVHLNEMQTDFEVLAVSDQEISTRGYIKLPERIKPLFEDAHLKKESIHEEKHFVGYFTTKHGLTNLLYVSYDEVLTNTEHDLLEFFANNIAVAYDNLRMREIVKESQHELSYMLGEAVERRSKETGSHVKRVANYSYMLAKLYGLDDNLASKIKLASPLHDVGKIAIPDRILNKPGKLDADEWAIMENHAQIGYDMLSESTNEVLEMGAIIAHQHHEKYDGKGYPRGLSATEIHIAGRISAIADVFDALASHRCYKPAWPLDKVLDLLREERGKHFDPKLVDLLLDNLDDFLSIRDAFPDTTDLPPTENIETR